MSGEIPLELYSMSNIRSVRLDGNSLFQGSISPQISQLINLKEFSAGETKIGGSIPLELYGLPSLQMLDISNSLFTGTLSEGLRQLNATLKQLDLNNNDFTGRLPDAIDQLTNLGKCLRFIINEDFVYNTSSLKPCSPTMVLPHTPEKLYLQGNQFTGSISQTVCDRRRNQELIELFTDCNIECNCCMHVRSCQT